MSYHHFTLNDRTRIESCRNLGCSNREIAMRLHRHHSSTDREIKRGSAVGEYVAGTAIESYQHRRRRSKSTGKLLPEIAKVIEEKLKATCSPEQIANTRLYSFSKLLHDVYPPLC